MEFSHRLEPDPNLPALVMAGSGETLTHGRMRARVNKVAHLLRAAGLRRGDHFAIFMENHPRYIECGRAGAPASITRMSIATSLRMSSPTSSTTASRRF
jgi:acyl-CoA synthetase (AMP-forming)/AMP-acid ligase II